MESWAYSKVFTLLGMGCVLLAGYLFAVLKVNRAFRRRRIRAWHYGLILLLFLMAWGIFALMDLMIPWTVLPRAGGALIRVATLGIYGGLAYGLVLRAPVRIRAVFIAAFFLPLGVILFFPWNTRKVLQRDMQKIGIGMTEREVKETMKGRDIKRLEPPYGAGQLIIQHEDRRRDDIDGILVWFDERKKVKRIEFNYD